jgi:hypothetical protein
MVMFCQTSLFFALALIPCYALTYGLSSSSMSKKMKSYDLIVIGGGSAGLTAAKVSRGNVFNIHVNVLYFIVAFLVLRSGQLSSRSI